MNDDNLDDRIRDLIGRAAADAPEPPDITAVQGALMNNEPTPDRRPWIIGGLAAASAAVLVAGIVVATNTDDTVEVVPATAPPVTITTVSPGSTVPGTTDSATPSPSVSPTTTVPPTNPTSTEPASTEASTNAATPPTPSESATTSIAPTSPAAQVSVVAGSAGVILDGVSITSQAMDIAVAGPNGQVFMQERRFGDSGEDAVILTASVDAAELTAVPIPGEWGDVVVELHDGATVDGEFRLLVETRSTGSCSDPATCTATLWTLSPASGAFDEIEQRNVWEGGWSRLTMSDTGVVVGAWSESVSSMPYSVTVDGASGSPVDFSALGLESSYDDCSNCPNGFAIDPTGTLVSWVELDLDTSQLTLSVSTLDGAVTETVLAGDYAPPVSPSTAVAADGTRAVVNDQGIRNAAERRTPLLVELPSGAVTVGPDPGFYDFGITG